MSTIEFWLRMVAGALLGSGAGYLTYTGFLEFASIPENSLGWTVAIGLIVAVIVFVAIEILDIILDIAA